jgi:benzoate-CoA ligase family protein
VSTSGVARPAPERFNATVDLLERNLQLGRADAPYLRTASRTISYAEASAMADGAGSGLLDLGLESGDRVILAMQDRSEFVATFWGAIKAGIAPVPVAQGLLESDLGFIVSDSEARAVVCDEASARAVVPAVADSGLPVLLVGSGANSEVRSWSEICGTPGSLEAAPTTRSDVALWLYTSGTTGLPKAVMHAHGSLEAAPQGLTTQVLRVEPDDVILSTSRMFFAYGLGNSVYLPAAAGASVILHEGPVVPTFVKPLVEKQRPTLIFGVPVFFAGYADLPDASLPSSVRACVTAGETLPMEVLERWTSSFGVPLLDGLGSTEALHHVTSNRIDDIVPQSVGRPLDGYEAQVLDREQQPVPEGEGGELWIRGPTLFVGYWRRPELTERAFMGGWMRTGDYVRMRDGRIFHEGRLDDMLKVGGIWVAPSEIEDVLRGHPDVSAAAVVGLDEHRGVPQLKAYVVSGRDDAGLVRELKALCRGRLASFKVPQHLEVVEELPRTPTGKVRRFVLRQDSS